MYRLTENEFLEKGVCRYEDNYGNRVMMKRGEEGFVAKLRLRDENIKAEPLRISFPLKGEGINLQLNQTCDAEDVKSGIDGFVNLVQYWISMESTIRLFNADNSYFRNQSDLSDEEIWKAKINALSQFVELKPLIGQTFN